MARPIDFFAYGTLLDQRRMMEAVERWDGLRTARLADHRLRFSRFSESWKGATADLAESAGESVYGVVYRLLSDQARALRRLHPGYVERRLTVETRAGALGVTALVVEHPASSLRPDPAYVMAIDEGMRQHGFAPEIRAALWRWTGLVPP